MSWIHSFHSFHSLALFAFWFLAELIQTATAIHNSFHQIKLKTFSLFVELKLMNLLVLVWLIHSQKYYNSIYLVDCNKNIDVWLVYSPLMIRYLSSYLELVIIHPDVLNKEPEIVVTSELDVVKVPLGLFVIL